MALLIGALILGNFTMLFGITPLSDYLASQDKEFETYFPLAGTLSDLSTYLNKITFSGNRNDATQDLSFNNYISINNFLTNSSTQGGAFSCKSFSLTNTEDLILLLNNFAIDSGGAIFSSNDVNLSDNHGLMIFCGNQSLPNNNSSSNENKGGAISSNSNCTISRNQATGYFVKNMTTYRGGAIKANQITIGNNKGPILFMDNTVINNTGGAIDSDQNIIIENNSKPIYFLNNRSASGGAIRAENVVIQKNSQSLVFSNNLALENTALPRISSGGAIHCSFKLSIEDNPGIISFNNNSCGRDGGAICAQSLSIKNSGPVYFTNNQGIWGGAVTLLQDGSCTLWAQHGDIIFYNNRHYATGTSTQNSLNCTSNVTITLGANENRSIVFYDPARQRHNVSSIQPFNPEPEHLGTILFSSAYVSDESVSREDFISLFRNTIGLYHGTLALDDRAEWKVFKFDQFGGTLRLGSGVVFSTTGSSTSDSAGSAININNLAINLPAILEKRSAPMLWIRPIEQRAPYTEDNNPTINLSGPLTLLNEENLDPYDSIDLSQPLRDVPLLKLSDVTAKHINTDNFHPETLNATDHYGYQGLWSPRWLETTIVSNSSSEDTVNTVRRELYADWTPIGYKVNPEHKGVIAVTTFWQSFHSLFATLRNQIHRQEGYAIAAGEAIGLFLHQNSTSEAPGFRIDATGYSLKTISHTASQHKVGISFTQLFSNTKESHSKNKVASHTTTLVLQLDNPWLAERFSISSCLAYSYGLHHLQGVRNSGTVKSEGRCYSTTLGATLCCSLPIQRHSKSLNLAPFIQAIAIRSTQTAFQEMGNKPRKFSTNQPLYNLTVPIGIQSSWHSHFHLSSYWDLELAYQPILYQQNPEVNVTLTTSGSTWQVSEITLARNGISFRGKNQTFLFPNVSVFLDYQGSVSSSTSSHYLQAGTTIQF